MFRFHVDFKSLAKWPNVAHANSGQGSIVWFFLKQNITPIQKRCAKAAFEYFFLPRFIGFQFCSNFVIFPSAESIIWPVLRDE